MPTAAPELDLLSIEKLREEELDEARAIQSGMLPTQPLRVGGITISHEFQPASLVGGDYLDYFSLPDGVIGMYIGDVSGKGLPAAMYAALAVGTLRGIHKTGQHPAQVMALLNKRLLLRGIPSRYTALQYALLDPVTGQLHLSSAGMPGPMLVRAGECQVLQVAGIPPGLFPEINYDHLTVQLEPGDSLLFYTDGLTDARNCHEAEFEAAGLQHVCGTHKEKSPLELLSHIFSTIQRFMGDCPQFDDMTAAILHYSGS